MPTSMREGQDGGITKEATMADLETFHLTLEQAELYEERLVPALFGNWADAVLDAADVRAGQDVLDVACGTGIVARGAADRTGSDARVTGVDLNPAMLAVASRLRPDLTWRQADAGALPFDDASFDVITCQAGVMFFPDVVAALREMARVTRPGGTVVVQAFERRENQPAYGPWIEMVARHAGGDAREMLGTYWRRGDPGVMRQHAGDAGLATTSVRRLELPAHFPSVEAMVLTEVNATPLRDRLSSDQLDDIVADSYTVLEPFHRTAEGALSMPLAGYVLVASPRSTEPGGS
jgi:SAM-dependent methyltransferase